MQRNQNNVYRRGVAALPARSRLSIMIYDITIKLSNNAVWGHMPSRSQATVTKVQIEPSQNRVINNLLITINILTRKGGGSIDLLSVIAR